MKIGEHPGLKILKIVRVLDSGAYWLDELVLTADTVWSNDHAPSESPAVMLVPAPIGVAPAPRCPCPPELASTQPTLRVA
jgi:hypothetical protein